MFIDFAIDIGVRTSQLEDLVPRFDLTVGESFSSVSIQGQNRNSMNPTQI